MSNHDPIRAALIELRDAVEGIELEGVPEVDEALAAARAALATPPATDELAALPAGVVPAEREVFEIKGMRNYYGGLNIKRENGNFYWAIENAANEFRWKEIPPSLFFELLKFYLKNAESRQLHDES